MKSGKTRSVHCNKTKSMQNCLECMEIVFEWNIFPGFISIQILRQIPKDLKARRLNPEQFEGIILFMSMFNDIDWTKWKILLTVSRIPNK